MRLTIDMDTPNPERLERQIGALRALLANLESRKLRLAARAAMDDSERFALADTRRVRAASGLSRLARNEYNAFGGVLVQ